MEQHPFEFLAGLGTQGSWYVNTGAGAIEDAGPMLPFMRGHEMHMLALNPRARLTVTEYVGRTDFAGVEALSLRLALSEGDSVLMHFDAESHLPLGFVLESQQPEITVFFSQWESAGEIRVFKRAKIHQGTDVFRYEYTSVEIGNLEPSIFQPPEL